MDTCTCIHAYPQAPRRHHARETSCRVRRRPCMLSPATLSGGRAQLLACHAQMETCTCMDAYVCRHLRSVVCVGARSKYSTIWAGFGVSEFRTGGAAVPTSLSLHSLATAGARASAFVTTAAADCPNDVPAICLASALSVLSSPSSPLSPSLPSAWSTVVSCSVAGAC